LVLILLVAVLLFAKSSRRWCFSDDYDQPGNKRGRAAGVGPGPGGKKATQVHRFILVTFIFFKYFLHSFVSF